MRHLGHHVVTSGLRPLSFTGLLLAHVTTNTDGSRLRWTELRLWRMISLRQGELITQKARDLVAEGYVEWEADILATDGLGFPEGDWLYQSMGPSLVYHRHPGGCRKGALARVAELKPGMVPCDRCWPDPELNHWQGDGPDRPPGLGPDDEIRSERDRPRVVICPSPAEVERALKDQPGRRDDGLPYMSGPAEQLLSEAATADPDLRAWLTSTESLTG